MAAAAREALQQQAAAIDLHIEGAVDAVEKSLSLRTLRTRSKRLTEAWVSYEQALTTLLPKVADAELRDQAKEQWRRHRDASDGVIEQLETLIETKQGEAPREDTTEADEAELKLAQAQVNGACDEVWRRLGILRKRLDAEHLNSCQIRVIQDEILAQRSDLSQGLNVAFSSLIALQKTAVQKLEANVGRDRALKQLNEELDKALGMLLELVTEPVASVAPANEDIATAVTSAMRAMRLGGGGGGPSYQAYAKETFPKFEGEIRKYPAWKKEMKELVLPGLEVVRQIRLLDKQSPEAVDLTNCTTVEEAWVELDTKYGNSVNISTTLMEEFLGYKLKGVSDESKVVELRTVVQKLNTNLRAVGFEDHLQASPFILNKIVEMLPRFWQNDYSKQKASLLAAATKAESGQPQWTAISDYLKSEALRIETDMPWSLDVAVQEAKWPKKANVNTNQSKVANTGSSKGVACPECNVIHEWFNWRTRQSKGSDRFTNCPKFKAGTSTDRAELLAKHGACARCTGVGHDRASCKVTTKCEIGGCAETHHPLVHGTSVAYVNALRVVNGIEDSQPAKFLHILSHKFDGATYIVFLDDGSDSTLISSKAAKRMGLKGFVETCYMLRCGDKKPSVAKRKMYKVDVHTNDGQKITMTCMEVEQITSKQEFRDVSEAYKLFPHVPPQALEVAVGEVDLMIGQDYAALLTTGGEGLNIVENLRAMRCRLGTGWVLGGWHPLIKGEGVDIAAKANLLRVQKRVSNPARVNLLQCSRDSEAGFADDLKDLSCQLPRVCSRCKNCSQCRHEVQDVTRQESEELRLIKDSITLDEEKQVCTASYPVIKDTSAFRNNQWQAEKMAMSLEKQLGRSPGGREKYNAEFDDFLKRKVLREVAQSEIKAWEDAGGKVNFVSHHAVERPDKATTKLRLVSNSSLRNSGRGPSPNSVWPKGPFGGGLQPLLEVLLRFRGYAKALHSDITKMFHSVKTGPEEMFMRLMVWRRDEQSDWTVYGFLVVTFGDRPATCITAHCLRLAAEAGRHLDPKAAQCLESDIYCDDICTGGTQEEVDRMVGEASAAEDGALVYTGTMGQILKKAGFRAKMMVTSGEQDDRALAKMGGSVLGIKWEPKEDVFTFKPQVFLGRKLRNGLYSGPELTDANLHLLDDFTWTRRLVLSTVASIYDPAGLISPLLIKCKLFLRELCQRGHQGWDEPLVGDLLLQWNRMVVEMVKMEPVVVRRSVRPANAVGLPELVSFVDGSLLAYACAVYIVYMVLEEKGGPWLSDLGQKQSYVASLLVSKARVTPLAGLTAPRSEMNGMVLGTRLSNLALRSMLEKPAKLTILGDSECCIAAVESDHGKLAPYLANRRVEVLEAFEAWGSSYPDMEVRPLHHVPGGLNIADLATRGTATAQQVTRGGGWQEGPAFLRQSFETWPVTRKIRREIPEDELLKKERFGLVNLLMASQLQTACACRVCTLVSRLRGVLFYSNSKLKVEGILARLLRLSQVLALRSSSAPVDEIEAKEIMRNPPLRPQELTKARTLMLQLSQPEVKQMFESPPSGKRKACKPHKNRRGVPAELDKRKVSGPAILNLTSLVPFAEGGVYWTRGRFGKELSRVLGPDKLAVLPSSCRLSSLIMEESHGEFHMGGGDTCFRSRTRAWIVHARPLADQVARDCLQCRRKLKCFAEQRMGFLPLERTDVFSKPFTNSSIDLLGPYGVKAMVNSRATMKVWVVVLVCLSTGALHIEVASSYGTDSFLVAFKTFVSLRGRPARVYTDLGSQIVKAATYATAQESPVNWNWSKVEEVEGRLGTEFRFCPAATAWRNGVAEQRVSGLKRGLDMLMLSGAGSLNFAEFVALVRGIANLINDRPLGVRHHNKGVEGELVPLTPNLLLLGKTSTGDLNSSAIEDGEDRFSRRAALVDKLERSWWDLWFRTCFGSLFPFDKWKETMGNLKVGDIVLCGHEKRLGKGEYRLARVKEVLPDESGLVRSAIIEFRPRGGPAGLPYTSKGLEERKVPVQKLVLIQPVEKQIQAKD